MILKRKLFGPFFQDKGPRDPSIGKHYSASIRFNSIRFDYLIKLSRSCRPSMGNPKWNSGSCFLQCDTHYKIMQNLKSILRSMSNHISIHIEAEKRHAVNSAGDFIQLYRSTVRSTLYRSYDHRLRWSKCV
jgi:hypothetical protein